MQIFARDTAGGATDLYVFPSFTVLVIRMMLRDLRGFCLDQVRLIHAGKQLEDGMTLRDYKIEHESTVYVVFRMRGGKPVILLYPTAPVDATVALELSTLWSFSALYPKPASSKLQQAATDSEVSLLIARSEFSETRSALSRSIKYTTQNMFVARFESPCFPAV